MASKGRTSPTGYRLDNPHDASYARFAGKGLERWSEFTIVVARMEHIYWAPESPAYRVAQKMQAFQFGLGMQEAYFELAQVSPDLTSGDLEASVIFRARDKLRISKLRYDGLAATGQFEYADTERPFIARRSTMLTLIGAMLLNLPYDFPASKSVNAIAAMLIEGAARKDKKIDLEDKVRRARQGFLRNITHNANHYTLTTAGGLAQGLAIVAHAEQALRALWSSPEAKRWMKSLSDCAQVVDAMIASQEFFDPMWEHFTTPRFDHNKDAIEAIRTATMQGLAPRLS